MAKWTQSQARFLLYLMVVFVILAGITWYGILTRPAETGVSRGDWAQAVGYPLAAVLLVVAFVVERKRERQVREKKRRIDWRVKRAERNTADTAGGENAEGSDQPSPIREPHPSERNPKVRKEPSPPGSRRKKAP